MEPTWNPTDLARWLRRRRKTRTGYSASPGDPDFYNDDGSHAGHEVPIGAFVVILLVVTLLVFGGWRLLFGDGGGSEIIGSPVTIASSTSLSTGTETPVSTDPPPTTELPTTGDPVLDRVLRAIGLGGVDRDAMLELRDLLGDIVDSIFGVTPSYQGRDIDIVQSLAALTVVDGAFVENAFGNTVYPCGDPAPLVVCATDALEVPVGDLLIVAVQMDGDIPAASTERSYVYSIVFDSDGDPGNDWVFNPPFDWDYFQGADRWYQATYDHTTGVWLVDVTQLASDGSIPAGGEASAVRLVIDGPWAVWFIPTSEFDVYPAPFRVTAFGHDGSFSESSRGGDVSGVDPTAPLSVPPVEPAFVSGG